MLEIGIILRFTLIEPRSVMVSMQRCYAGDPGSIPAGVVSRVRVETLGSVSVNHRLTHQGCKNWYLPCGRTGGYWPFMGCIADT